MSDNIKILRNYLLYFLTFFIVCIVGVSGVFADERLDTSTWINTTGRTWSLSGQEYHSGGLTADNAWTKSYYNIPSGIYTPPSSYDYITWAYFQHNGGYNPCSGGNYRVNFSIKFSVPSFVNYVSNLKFEDNNCTIVKDTSTGIIQANCLINYRNTSGIYIIADFNEISGNTSSDFYISRYIDTSCDMNSGAIIENNTQNTQNIINNNNQNTENIINNQNENTEKEIESQKVCNPLNIYYDKNNFNDGIPGYLDSTGGVVSNSGWVHTDFIFLDKNHSYDLNINSTWAQPNYCLYDENKTLISCEHYVFGSINRVISNTSYIVFSYGKESYVSVSLTGELCKNGNQVLNDSITGLNDSLTDSSPVDMSTLGNTAGWLPAGPIDSIINLPLNFLNNLLTALNGTCQPLNVPIPFLNTNLPVPCINTIFNQIDGLPNFWNWVGAICSIVILYRYLLSLYKYYDDLTTLKANFISDFGGAP